MIDPQQIFNLGPESRIMKSDNEIMLTWNVPEKLPYFEGHFPGNPILPGVALLDLIEVLLKGTLKAIKSAKFMEVVRPLDTLQVEAKLDPLSGVWSVLITNQAGVTVSKIQASIT
jgi:3-hydroxymyristoyl/3-hydroxydecanoyl-(acyl carrier protein) dehydratase